MGRRGPRLRKVRVAPTEERTFPAASERSQGGLAVLKVLQNAHPTGEQRVGGRALRQQQGVEKARARRGFRASVDRNRAPAKPGWGDASGGDDGVRSRVPARCESRWDRRQVRLLGPRAQH